MNPHIIRVLHNGYKEKIKEQDNLQHLWWGNYGISAFMFAMEHCLHGNKAKSEYIKKPVLSEEAKEKNGYKESQEEVSAFEMMKRIKLLKDTGLPESPE